MPSNWRARRQGRSFGSLARLLSGFVQDWRTYIATRQLPEPLCQLGHSTESTLRHAQAMWPSAEWVLRRQTLTRPVPNVGQCPCMYLGPSTTALAAQEQTLWRVAAWVTPGSCTISFVNRDVMLLLQSVSLTELGRPIGSTRLHPHLPYSNKATPQVSDLPGETR